VSIDDFYLTHDAQQLLARSYPQNPYLEHRGYPGTHDVALGDRVVADLLDGGTVAIPVYDKSAHGGRGDRAPTSTWRRVHGPFDAVILEGWMLGFRPVPDETLEDTCLVPPNRMLAEYARWHHFLGAFVHLEARSLEDIVGWRIDAEQARRARGAAALSDAEARDYIERFLPAYRLYVPPLRDQPWLKATLHVPLGRDRMPSCRIAALG
jgi:D-glycerate 3-kinase